MWSCSRSMRLFQKFEMCLKVSSGRRQMWRCCQSNKKFDDVIKEVKEVFGSQIEREWSAEAHCRCMAIWCPRCRQLESDRSESEVTEAISFRETESTVMRGVMSSTMVQSMWVVPWYRYWWRKPPSPRHPTRSKESESSPRDGSSRCSRVFS